MEGEIVAGCVCIFWFGYECYWKVCVCVCVCVCAHVHMCVCMHVCTLLYLMPLPLVTCSAGRDYDLVLHNELSADQVFTGEPHKLHSYKTQKK